MQIIQYPHPTLRHKSKPLKRVDAELHRIVRQMFELMYEAKGIGLAANQVHLPVRLFVVNLEADPATGEEQVFINPVLSHPKGSEEREEGCLSIPGLYGDVVRPKQVRISAYNLQGEEILGTLDGLLARCVQHETDHLDGVLFTDRLRGTVQMEVRDQLEEFATDFRLRQSTGEVPGEQQLAEQLAEWERRYC